MPSIASGFTSAGAIIGVSPCSAALRHREVDQGQLQLGADPGEEVEPGAGDLGPALGVDRPEQLAQLDVVAHRLRVVGHGADPLQHDRVVLAAGRHAVGDHVGDGPVRGPDGLVGGGLRGLGGPDVVGQPLGPPQQLLPLLAGGPRHLLGDRLLLGPQRVGGGHGGAAPLVRREQFVHQRRVLAARALRGTDPLRVGPEQSQIDHPSQGTGAGQALCAAHISPFVIKIDQVSAPNE